MGVTYGSRRPLMIMHHYFWIKDRSSIRDLSSGIDYSGSDGSLAIGHQGLALNHYLPVNGINYLRACLCILTLCVPVMASATLGQELDMFFAEVEAMLTEISDSLSVVQENDVD